MSPLVKSPSRILFFTGKGGVGKTSAACATAISIADAGKRVLLVSTDPASNLDEVLGVELSGAPTPVPEANRLFALNIDPEQAAHAYRERIVGPYRGLLPQAALASMEEQLSGACTVEIAAFDEFSKLLGDPATTAEFDHVVFDTAPTGHTLRLLELPAAWGEFIDANVGGTSCLGPLSGLQAQKALYAESNRALRDPSQTTLVLVARPDRSALREAERTRAELADLGVMNVRLVMNGIFVAESDDDPVAVAMEERGRDALSQIPAALRELPRIDVPLLPFGLVGLDALRQMGTEGKDHRSVTAELAPVTFVGDSLDDLIDQLARLSSGVVMTMGKGGVGKTTVAARIASALARRGLSVTLTTTDPAAHVAQALLDLGESAGELRVTRVDPSVETQRYAAEVLSEAGSNLDAAGKALLEEELRSPCTEEIAVFRAFAQVVAEGETRFVVIDTAPTGHTLLLLDSAEAFHREVLRKPSGNPEAVKQLLPRLRDSSFTHVLLVTLPEATPIHEAMQLEKDLLRAGIEPFAWVVNQSLIPLEVKDPVLRTRRSGEATHLEELSGHATRVLLESWSA